MKEQNGIFGRVLFRHAERSEASPHKGTPGILRFAKPSLGMTIPEGGYDFYKNPIFFFYFSTPKLATYEKT